MGLYDYIFYLFAALTLVSGFFVFATKNIVRAAFNLMFALFGISGLYALLGADFLAVVQILVYVGGILILILFGVMLTNRIKSVEVKKGALKIIPASAALVLFSGILIYLFNGASLKETTGKIPQTTVLDLGSLLMNQYILVFELLGMVLLLVLIGSVYIARSEEK